MKSNYKVVPNNLSKIENSKFMMFVEQYMLRQLSTQHKQKVNLLIDDFCYDNNGLTNSIGVNLNNCGSYFYHYGDHKKHMVNKNQFCLDEINTCVYKTNEVIKNEEGLNIFNKIGRSQEEFSCEIIIFFSSCILNKRIFVTR
jgi:hypothetical protein